MSDRNHHYSDYYDYDRYVINATILGDSDDLHDYYCYDCDDIYYHVSLLMTRATRYTT